MAVIERLIADASYVEITERKERLGRDLHAQAYFFNKRRVFIISAVSGSYETGTPSVLPEAVSDEELGRVICDHLLEFDIKTPSGLNFRKMTEWPVFVASGASSVASFQSQSWGIAVTTIGDNSVHVDVSPMKGLHPEITVAGVARPKHVDVGAVTKRALAGAIALRDKAVI